MRKQQAVFSILLGLALGLALVIATSQKARADFDSDEAFKESTRTSTVTCHDQNACKAQGLELVSLYDAGNASSAAPEVVAALSRLTAIAQDQATIWADTILEGAFEAEGNTALDRVEGILRGGRLVSYRITYSERAWTIGDDGAREREGRIEEASFVSKSLRSWLRDDQSLATFR